MRFSKYSAPTTRGYGWTGLPPVLQVLSTNAVAVNEGTLCGGFSKYSAQMHVQLSEAYGTSGFNTYSAQMHLRRVCPRDQQVINTNVLEVKSKAYEQVFSTNA